LSHAEVLLKRGRDDNEMTRYRYDVLLYKGPAPAAVDVAVAGTWSAGGECVEGPAGVFPANVPGVGVVGGANAGVGADMLAWQALAASEGTAGELRQQVAAEASGAVEPEALWELGERLGYRVRMTWSRDHGADCMDVLFERMEVAHLLRWWLLGR